MAVEREEKADMAADWSMDVEKECRNGFMENFWLDAIF